VVEDLIEEEQMVSYYHLVVVAEVEVEVVTIKLKNRS
jgi:hypothetical protein